jgi:hypothetical protein
MVDNHTSSTAIDLGYSHQHTGTIVPANTSSARRTNSTVSRAQRFQQLDGLGSDSDYFERARLYDFQVDNSDVNRRGALYTSGTQN